MPNTMPVDNSTTVPFTGGTSTPMPSTPEDVSSARFLQMVSDRAGSASRSASKPPVGPKPTFTRKNTSKNTPSTIRLTQPKSWPQPQPAQVAPAQESASTPKATAVPVAPPRSRKLVQTGVPPSPTAAPVQANRSAPTPHPRRVSNCKALDGTTTAQEPLLKPKTRRAPEPTRAMRFKRRCAALVPTPLKRAWAAAGDTFEGLRGGMSHLLQRLRPRQA